MLWLREGDKNTKCFHNMSNVRRRINYIGRIRGGGKIVEMLSGVKEEVATLL